MQENAKRPKQLVGRKVVLVATNMGTGAGGEAMKAHQYAAFLEGLGANLTVIVHERSVENFGANQDAHKFLVIRNDWLQIYMWRIKPLQFGVDLYFHLRARALIKRHFPATKDTIVHYIAPISPVKPRFPPKGCHNVIGPVSGNIYYPDAFWGRMPVTDKLKARLHVTLQRVFGMIFGDKRAADCVLNSGYDRTRASLQLAGCRDNQIIDVLDSGINPDMADRIVPPHQGTNTSFMCSGRLVDVKAFDLAIRALQRCTQNTTLSIYGEGDDRPKLERLARDLGLAERVAFHGWTKHAKLITEHQKHRGFIFPSLAESNGIAMQEAMMLGLPVVALRWGGPAALADDGSAIYIEPVSEDHVITELAAAMDRLSTTPQLAEQLAQAAHQKAKDTFGWDQIARSWLEAY